MHKADEHLIERRLASETLFKGNFLEARRDTVALPDGRSATREYVTHPGAVVIVPLLEDGRVVIERQYRYPVGRVMVEFPAGKLDAGEDPLRCGRRELLEETGYTAREWAKAGEMHLAIAYSTEVLHIYFARGLRQGERQLDEGEFLDVSTATPAQLLDWSRAGELTDAKSLSCLLWLQNVLSGAWTLDWHADPGSAPTPAG
ncbi:NUDIX hydrolase [Hylemonella gracilis]|jgi:ADP-ribose pyrophosphatase|uniref:GDP-mannose pyrophosphatase n=1 Tax=Hylemonella gracilis TaxID=80880 RepID=A0A4P6ULG0_9BURK|nr:NUDIX hydrolase [Hylemonella gracilis]QBK05993.1 NUDIX hydrolase [Hylemonella gracilis]